VLPFEIGNTLTEMVKKKNISTAPY